MLPILLLTGLWGCGDIEPLDEPGDVYTASLVFLDVSPADDETISIDIFQNLDCNGDGVFDDPEDYGPVYAYLTVAIDSSVNGLTLDSYDIEYIPLSTPLSGGGTIVPIDLEDAFDQGDGTDYFGSGTTTSLTFTFMTTQTKTQYYNWWTGGAPQNTQVDQSRYNFRLTCHFIDDSGVEREMEFNRTVYLGAFDNC